MFGVSRAASPGERLLDLASRCKRRRWLCQIAIRLPSRAHAPQHRVVPGKEGLVCPGGIGEMDDSSMRFPHGDAPQSSKKWTILVHGDLGKPTENDNAMVISMVMSWGMGFLRECNSGTCNMDIFGGS